MSSPTAPGLRTTQLRVELASARSSWEPGTRLSSTTALRRPGRPPASTCKRVSTVPVLSATRSWRPRRLAARCWAVSGSAMAATWSSRTTSCEDHGGTRSPQRISPGAISRTTVWPEPRRTAYGVRFGAVLMTHNAFGDNQVSGAGSAAIFVQWACSNTFLGNNLEGNGRSPSAIFDATTGANVLVLVGAKNLVIDNGGGFDCDGDGVGDPNIIAGPGRVVRGVSVASPADAAVGSSGRLQ